MRGNLGLVSLQAGGSTFKVLPVIRSCSIIGFWRFYLKMGMLWFYEW